MLDFLAAVFAFLAGAASGFLAASFLSLLSLAALSSLVAVVLYYVLIKIIGDKILLHALYIIPLIWLTGTYVLYSKTIKKEY